MTLSAGTRLGPYEITAPLGAGGMGEVWRARDVRLGREVAIKVLPEALAREPERMSRFEREAHVLASLNHAHIAALYGLEESNGRRALVMELVEGPTLADRLAHGAIPLEEALPIAVQIAEALEYAHERGIVHRDLKPANVKLTADGAVKVLDFGLAKALADDPLSPEVSNSPTLSAVATRAGIILGTAAYMSPEQAKGKTADRRSDVWSFGVVLCEMLTGKRLYSGETAPETLARVIERDPDYGGLPAQTPRRIRDLLRRCLTKDPRKRLQAIGEARVAIEDAIAHPREVEAAPRRPRTAPWVVAVAAAAAFGLAIGARAPWRAATPPPAPVRLTVELGADASLLTLYGPSAALSPDGALLAFVARKNTAERPQLYLRRLDQLQASAVSGTQAAEDPFFSPDGQWIGFFAEGKLKKVAVTGGAAVTLCDLGGAGRTQRGGSWSEDGTIIFAPRSLPGVGLSRVSSAGGQPEVLTTPDAAVAEITHRWPQVLPGGRAVLFTAHNTLGNYEDASIVVRALPGGPSKVVQRGGYFGQYLPSGHLVYIHEGTLFAAPFDLERLETAGPPAPVLEGVTTSPASGGAQFSFSSRGTLAYQPGARAGSAAAIQWMDREGKTQPLRSMAGDYHNLRFSPDGQKLAMDVRDGKQSDVWVYEWARDTMTRLTFDPRNDSTPVWSPDGRRIAFSSARGDKTPGGLSGNLYWQRADGTGEAERLTESENNQVPTSWHPSGRFIAFAQGGATALNPDIYILPIEGDEAAGWKPGKPQAFLNTPFAEVMPAFSPDGRWLAYMSTESGRPEVYVRPFPGPGGKWQVSTDGGGFPTWSRTRKELFYRTVDQRIMVSAYAVERDSFRADKPRLWSEGRFAATLLGTRNFDLHPDGQRFAVLKSGEEQAETKRDKVVLVQNFFDELRRLAPPRGR
jgi:serine/threonine-protein kinase